MSESLKDYCVRTGRQEILAEWDREKNGALTPADVSFGSNIKPWWRCEKGHEWQATVKSRTAGSGCPVCANREIRQGENDLAALFPELAKQWHPTKNGDLTPQSVFPCSKRKVWWRCEKGHEWRAEIESRTKGAGCPVCAGKLIIPGENDLATFFPEIAAQWHPTKNGNLTPWHVAPYSNLRVWWICPLGHEYQAKIARRTGEGSGCPYCAGQKVLAGFNDLATIEPRIAAQWHPLLNGVLTPQMVTAQSNKKVWWICSEGHVWEAAIFSRAGKQKSDCPVCSGHVSVKRLQKYSRMLAEQCDRCGGRAAGAAN